MALLTSEIMRIRVELGYNALNVGAEPYIGTQAVFNQVIQTYMQGGASTTSSTTVTAASAPTPVTLTLASATGFTVGDRVAVDVDARYESAVIETLSGSTATVLLSSAHSGTYPVSVEGGESIVREALRAIAACKAQLTGSALRSAGLKRADEVEFYADQKGASSRLADTRRELMAWRDELAGVLGVVNYWRTGRGGGGARGVALF